MSWVGTDWKARVLTMSTAELRELVKQPAHGPRGMKAFAKRELARREHSQRCSQCHRKTQALLFGKCGVCLRMNTTTTTGRYCNECGEWEPSERIIAGRCPNCHIAVMCDPGDPLPEGYIMAGDGLPVAEVFTREELKHLEFIRSLVASGRMSS